MEYTVSRDVDADSGTVWAVIADVERMPAWTSTMTRVRVLDGGELRVGSRVRVEQPRLPTATWEVTELEPGRSYTWASPAPGLQSVAWHAVEPTRSGPEPGHARHPADRAARGRRDADGPADQALRRHRDRRDRGGGDASYVRTSVRCTLWWSSG